MTPPQAQPSQLPRAASRARQMSRRLWGSQSPSQSPSMHPATAPCLQTRTKGTRRAPGSHGCKPLHAEMSTRQRLAHRSIRATTAYEQSLFRHGSKWPPPACMAIPAVAAWEAESEDNFKYIYAYQRIHSLEAAQASSGQRPRLQPTQDVSHLHSICTQCCGPYLATACATSSNLSSKPRLHGQPATQQHLRLQISNWECGRTHLKRAHPKQAAPRNVVSRFQEMWTGADFKCSSYIHVSQRSCTHPPWETSDQTIFHVNQLHDRLKFALPKQDNEQQKALHATLSSAAATARTRDRALALHQVTC